jgi:hypothetical protein
VLPAGIGAGGQPSMRVGIFKVGSVATGAHSGSRTNEVVPKVDFYVDADGESVH